MLHGADDVDEENARFETIARRSVASDAVDQIKRLIASGRLKPGDRLPGERELSTSLGVSRPTLREAIRSLVVMGMLESRHGDGTYVTDLASATISEPFVFMLNRSSSSLRELVGVRLMLESGATELAAGAISPGELAELRRILDELGDHRGDPDAFADLDVVFHRTIHVASRNKLLLAMLDSIAHLGRQSRAVTVRRPGVIESSLRGHAVILEALERGDAGAARDAMIAHLAHVRDALDQEEPG